MQRSRPKRAANAPHAARPLRPQPLPKRRRPDASSALGEGRDGHGPGWFAHVHAEEDNRIQQDSIPTRRRRPSDSQEEHLLVAVGLFALLCLAFWLFVFPLL